MRNLMLSLCALMLMLPFTLAAADITGSWTGSIEMTAPDGSTQTMTVTSEFKQDGATVTGTAGTEGQEQFAIEKGTVDGSKFTFEVSAPDSVYAVSLTIVSDTEMKGGVTFTAQDGNKVTAKIALTKGKS